MIVPDVNLLLYAVDSTSPRHPAAHAWLEAQLSGSGTVGFTWSVLTGFVRLATHPSVFDQPLTPTQAFDLVDGWLSQPVVIVVHPGDRHSATMRDLLEPFGTAGNLVTDAHLAAAALEHGATLASSDHDFGRFAGLRWSDPIARERPTSSA